MRKRESVIDHLSRFLLHCVCVVGVCVFMGSGRCRSYPIKEEIRDQRNENEKAKAIAKAYIPAGPAQDRVVKALENSSELLAETGEEAEKQKARAEKNQGAAKTIFWAKVLASLTAAAVGFYCVKKFGASIPLIGRFL